MNVVYMPLKKEHNIFDIVPGTKNLFTTSMAQTDTRWPPTAKAPSSISGKSISDLRWTNWH